MVDAVELTRRLVAFNTVNPPGEERPLAEHLAAILEGAGFRLAFHEFAPRRTSLVARIGSGAGKPLCLTGHLDTVPLGARPWARDPFAGETAEGRLHGRGSSDMKSGVAAAVAAAVRLAPRLAGAPGAVLVLTAGEETGCEGAFHLAGLSGALGEAGAVVVAEPTANAPLAGHKGALWLKARTEGVTAHGSMPERGVNAVYKAARAIARLEDFDFNLAPHPVMGRPTLNVGFVHGGLNINSVPDRAEIGIDIRTVAGQGHRPLRDGLAGHLGPEVAIETLIDVEAVWTDPAHPWMAEVYEVAAAVAGHAAEPRAASFFTDAAALTAAYGGPPTVILGPGEPALAHQTDEWCAIARIEEAAEIYARLLARWNRL
jgi:succinyl-diaminopimelate desuccinylase